MISLIGAIGISIWTVLIALFLSEDFQNIVDKFQLRRPRLYRRLRWTFKGLYFPFLSLGSFLISLILALLICQNIAIWVTLTGVFLLIPPLLFVWVCSMEIL